jgi:hypothetical protein
MNKQDKFVKDIKKSFKDYFKVDYSDEVIDIVLDTYDWNSWLLLGGCGLDLNRHLDNVHNALYNH